MGPGDEYGEGTLLSIRGDYRHVFRLLKAQLTTESDWYSNYERGSRPRNAEVDNALVHFGLSCWESAERAVAVNEGFKGRLGNFVGEVVLSGGLGIWCAETGSPGHVLVWGRPADLQRSVVEIHPV